MILSIKRDQLLSFQPVSVSGLFPLRNPQRRPSIYHDFVRDPMLVIVDFRVTKDQCP